MPGTSTRTTHVSLAEGLLRRPSSADNLAVPIFSHGSLVVELYSPRGQDTQQPHERDEVYVVARGSGQFFDGRERLSVGPGSFIFVAAGQPHRFEDFSLDFTVWVFFYGPGGGESRA